MNQKSPQNLKRKKMRLQFWLGTEEETSGLHKEGKVKEGDEEVSRLEKEGEVWVFEKQDSSCHDHTMVESVWS